MPVGVEITPTTLAASTVDGSREETFFDYALDPALLRDGENVIAVEVHQINATSSDIGFDLELTRTIADSVEVPVIASGGVGNLDHLVEGVTKGHASAVLAASIFHFGTFTIGEAKAYMADHGIAMRLDS